MCLNANFYALKILKSWHADSDSEMGTSKSRRCEGASQVELKELCRRLEDFSSRSECPLTAALYLSLLRKRLACLYPCPVHNYCIYYQARDNHALYYSQHYLKNK